MTASKKIAWLVLGVLLTAEGGAQAQEANGAMFAASPQAHPWRPA